MLFFALAFGVHESATAGFFSFLCDFEISIGRSGNKAIKGRKGWDWKGRHCGCYLLMIRERLC
jgi:hypothetical protein